ncbi:hypothetical protein BDW22DRAFT_1354138 [Trametopsis cervina]|nr:hypothetical protein BDW22DRAFT_1354138 [Trametopsis cervina]
MSQAKLTLRPPPNVDFVQGYPGIPPGAPDRPQAAVKGAIEVRVGPAGVKAKWVRIELRKIETLPGGGLGNTYFDFVGQSPINLWQAQGDHSPLSTQDFQFYIRIPESIPPTIALERGAGIKYELIATLCIKGKKGLFRRDKPVVLSTTAPIIIDKHELHSTWPVYAQPEMRNLTQDGVTLTIERTHTCYGPGDRISVNATVKSDALHTVILRGFEFALRETMVFRAGGNASGKKGAPQVKASTVGEQKVPVNATLYGGTMHKAELAVTIPERHTTTTLNAARHIDITYVLTVRALLSSGQPIMMDLPVIISNWPKSVSVAAVRRIGLASNVSSHGQAQQPLPQLGQHIIPPSNLPLSPAQSSTITSPQRQQSANHPYLTPAPAPPATTITDSSDATDSIRPANNFNTAPAANGISNGYGGRADEFGRARGNSFENEIQTIGGPTRPFVEDATPRPRVRSNTANTANRLTVTNFADDMPEEVRAQQAQQAAQLAARTHARQTSLTGRTATAGGGSRGWMTAEEEKRRLYESAQAKVEAAHQGNIPRAASPPIEIQTPQPIRSATLNTVKSNGSLASSARVWPTAEEEKARLFNQAQDAVRRTQGSNSAVGSSSPPSESAHSRNGSLSNQAGMSSGAALYSQAMSSMSRNASATSSATIGTAKLGNPGFTSADEEKAALKRYYDAKAAVDRTQASAYDPIPEGSSSSPRTPPSAGPVAYDALYPNSTPKPTMSPPPPGPGELPPAFSPGANGQPQYLSEKEKLRRNYEARDAAALAAQAQAQPPAPTPNPHFSNDGPPTASAPPEYGASHLPFSNGVTNGLSEKEILRRKYERQDAVAMASRTPPATPPRTADGGRALPMPRTQPTPPGSANGLRPLTAAEEKARLRAMYESEDRGGANALPTPPLSPPMYVNGANGANGAFPNRQPSLTVTTPDWRSIPPPPPLLPRPPKEYIQETQQEDQKVAAQIEAIDADSVHGSPDLSKIGTGQEPQPAYGNSFPGSPQQSESSRPPLPPKVGLDDP